ncbi:MAG TPA: lysophospholipid acyltransferase family protein [Magnetospirillaceae bacterium]|jgi:1-acyl-sn-glycerol-3-phosphate acyltransferase
MDEIHSPLTAWRRVLGCLALTLSMAPLQAVLLSLGAIGLSRRWARLYWRGMAFMLGMRLIVRGTLSERRPTLYICNHISYLDIVALGAVLDAAFVAKAEIRGWPGIGIVARLGRTVFVDRRRGNSKEHRDSMLERLTKARESVILFPEGTSNDGNLVGAFKSALLSAAAVKDTEGHALAVQPVTIAYTRLDGMPIGRSLRALYAWFGDMALAPHMWTMIGLGITTIEIELHPVTSLEQFGSRKALSDHCYRTIANGLAAANAGRLPEVGEAVPDLA